MPDLGRGMVIPSATSQTLQAALAAPSPNVLLTGVALDELPERAKQVLGAGKHAIVHADMTSGLHPNAAALSFLKDHCGVETIISTNAKAFYLIYIILFSCYHNYRNFFILSHLSAYFKTIFSW